MKTCRRWGCINPTATKGGKLCKPHLDESRAESKIYHHKEMVRRANWEPWGGKRRKSEL